MEFMLDTVNIEQIIHYQSIVPIAGVTSNPTILKKNAVDQFYPHLQKVKQVIGTSTLHVQVTGETTKEMVADAEAIRHHLGKDTYIKIPVNAQGLAAINQLKSEGAKITATAIYSEFQGYLAINAGVDYLAPYVNRMTNLGIDAIKIIAAFAQVINKNNSKSKILAASFATIEQVNQTIHAGAHAVTIDPTLIEQALKMPAIQQAVKVFQQDWQKNFNTNTVNEL